MSVIEIKVPDIGEFTDVPVIEILVQPGDTVAPEDPLVTLESDKATMEVPAPAAGKVVEILVSLGDTVSEGSAIVRLEAGDAAASEPAEAAPATAPPRPRPPAAPAGAVEEVTDQAPDQAQRPGLPPPVDFGNVHASPSVRMIARELGVDLTKLTGSGAKGRITKDDVKRAVAGGTGSRGAGRRRDGNSADPGPGLLEVRPGRGETAVAPQTAVRTASPSRLAQRAPRHAHR